MQNLPADLSPEIRAALARMTRVVGGKRVEYRVGPSPMELVNQFDILEATVDGTVHTSKKGGSAIDSERPKEPHRANLNPRN